jgi:acetylornithine deacetylase/succinyl-diaminopimelate desuccinylase-like protein
MLGLAEELAVDATRRRKRIVFASTIDEENGVDNGTLLLHLAGVRADAALYLDGYQMEINIGCLGGSNLYLRPKPGSGVGEPELLRDLRRLAEAAHEMSLRRAPMFDLPMYADNIMRESSVLTSRRDDAAGPQLAIHFYTLPDEEPAAFMRELEAVIDGALGPDAAGYTRSYRQPWFEPALIPADTPLIGHVAGAARGVLGREPRIATISKQDSFLLINHAKIPTVAFGVTARVTGRGAFHHPDEHVTIDELWTGWRIAREAVGRWLAS